MPVSARLPRVGFRSFHLPALTVFMAVLWIAGGASKADALGQVVVRGAAWIVLVALALAGRRPRFELPRPVLVLLAASVLLVALQLVPLPPVLWQLLPGRELLTQAASNAGEAQPWRPWSIVPGATINALSSLVVPLTTLLLVAGLDRAERLRVPALLLFAIVASMILALIQFSGLPLGNPLINDTLGQVSANFANRNHLALFLAIGCLLTPVWVFLKGSNAGWRAPAGAGILILLILSLPATGSRAGLALGALGLALGATLVWRDLRRALRAGPRWAFAATIATAAAIVTLLVFASIAAGRAEAINRLLSDDPSRDMRTRGLPTILDMIGTYFPIGSGFGGFDPIFRIHEPFDLLKPTYFNHAHNDYLEVVLDGGLCGLALLLGGLGWWAVASLRAWRIGPGPSALLPKLGSAMLLLIAIASIFDYPARTPLIMAVLIIAGTWLSGAHGAAAAALPVRKQHL